MDDNKDGFKESKIIYEGDKKVRAELDEDKDGKTDYWIWYRSDGTTLRTCRDNDKDGKPDIYTLIVKPRALVLKEYDHNGDGRVDERVQQIWDGKKSISVPQPNGRIQKIPNPGYKTVWREKDTDFDGLIDEYTERGDKNAAVKKVGKKIQTNITETAPEELSTSEPKKSEASEGTISRLVREKNAQYDYNQ